MHQISSFISDGLSDKDGLELVEAMPNAITTWAERFAFNCKNPTKTPITTRPEFKLVQAFQRIAWKIGDTKYNQYPEYSSNWDKVELLNLIVGSIYIYVLNIARFHVLLMRIMYDVKSMSMKIKTVQKLQRFLQVVQGNFSLDILTDTVDTIYDISFCYKFGGPGR